MAGRGLPWLEVAVPFPHGHPVRSDFWKDTVTVIIGMDPHKRSATIEIIDQSSTVLATGRYSTDTTGYRKMLAAAGQFPDRVWAIEGLQRRRPAPGTPADPPW
ncbi:IS110 family transposase [Nocardia amamiensis]|uniref:IS110 family transposase n=1 Tax=Nocardia amamiensis TaxID=404578 RepID=UPI001E583472|nr:IS110 family transposase [Nocardia amamiensis]